MNEHDAIQSAANVLAGYATTCQTHNSLEWMEGFALVLNAYLESVQFGERVDAWGY